jgi:hypothetical protein
VVREDGTRRWQGHPWPSPSPSPSWGWPPFSPSHQSSSSSAGGPTCRSHYSRPPSEAAAGRSPNQTPVAPMLTAVPPPPRTPIQDPRYNPSAVPYHITWCLSLCLALAWLSSCLIPYRVPPFWTFYVLLGHLISLMWLE